jgi:serine protease Do
MPRSFQPRLRSDHLILFLVVAAFSLQAARVQADEVKDKKKPLEVPAAFFKKAPESIDDLKAMEAHVKAVVDRVVASTVCVRMGNSTGSGVIISEDGYVLTAAHVSDKPDQEITLLLKDGTSIKARTLGLNRTIDSGLIKITAPGKWPYVEMGNSGELKDGQWLLAVGHPGGFQEGRTPVVRLGRVIEHTNNVVRTDCTLVGGDSGGPLFDMQGRVVGINSRIGNSYTTNFHVPVNTFHDTWDRLVEGESWGGTLGGPASAWLGARPDSKDKDECKLLKIIHNSPAEKAGLKTNDIITMFDGNKVLEPEDLQKLVKRKKPGDAVDVELKRGGEPLTLRVTLSE